MKKKNILYLLVMASLIMSCSNESEDINFQSSDIKPNNELDLNTFSYETLSSQLTSISNFGKSIILKDKDSSHEVYVSLDDRTQIDFEGENIRLYNGEEKDSTSLILGSTFASLRYYRNGEYINYIAYKDAQTINEIANLYVASFSKTRAGDINKVIEYIYKSKTRSNENDLAAIKVNITKARKLMNISEEGLMNDYIQVPDADLNVQKTSTRAIPTEPKTVYVVCLKENGATLYPNEVSAQMQDAANSIYDINNAEQYINLHFVLNITDFACPNDDADYCLGKFANSVREDPRGEGYDDQIFFLVRWGIWDKGTLGIAYVNSYNVDKANGFRACGMSTTQLYYSGTLAHELGHIFGANHVDDSTDLMYYANTGYKFHKDDANMLKISHNFGWDESD